MTSFRQFVANRRNARKSTGPTTEEGKQRSRCNAVRHGLTAETVIGALEDAEDYKAFEGAIIADYDAQSAVERELVLRLASLLWRLRRATTMETGLVEIQAAHLGGIQQSNQVSNREVVYTRFGRADSAGSHLDRTSDGSVRETEEVSGSIRKSFKTAVNPTVELARCFLGLLDRSRSWPLLACTRFRSSSQGCRSILTKPNRGCLPKDRNLLHAARGCSSSAPASLGWPAYRGSHEHRRKLTDRSI